MNIKTVVARIAGVVLLPLICAPVYAEEPAEPRPAGIGEVSIAGQVGSDQEAGLLEALLPLYSPSEDTRVFGDLRGLILQDSEWEANAGLVLRSFNAERDAILGANLFYDHRSTDAGNDFSQIGAGIEWLGSRMDARANVYVALDDPQVVSESTSVSVQREGGAEISTTTASRIYEETLEGADAELGYWIVSPADPLPVGAFLGYYHFEGDSSEELSGFTARIEARFHDKLILDVEWFEDEELNGSDYLVGLRFRHRFGGGASETTEQRMTDPLNRSFGMYRRMMATEEQLARDQRQIRRSSAPVMTMEEAAATPRVCRLNEFGEVVCR